MYLTNVQEFKCFHLKSKAGINEHQNLKDTRSSFHWKTTMIPIWANFKDQAIKVITFFRTKILQKFCYVFSYNLKTNLVFLITLCILTASEFSSVRKSDQLFQSIKSLQRSHLHTLSNRTMKEHSCPMNTIIYTITLRPKWVSTWQILKMKNRKPSNIGRSDW